MTTDAGPPDRRARARAISPGLRRFGLLLIIVGAGLILWARYGGAPAAGAVEIGGTAALVGGWVIYAAVLVQRAMATRGSKP